ANAGVLTITDGTHTARIDLRGDYLGDVFTATSDGHGGTRVVDPAAAAAALLPPHRFIAAAASFGAVAAGPSEPPRGTDPGPPPTLATPRAA
ncbi:MAG: hypothetical protein ACR2FH_11650, partial [Caulobacteraceae bacterium]